MYLCNIDDPQNLILNYYWFQLFFYFTHVQRVSVKEEKIIMPVPGEVCEIK
jgi:hypothetical protein